MHRLVTLGKVCLASAPLLAVGCASQPIAQSPTPFSTPIAIAAVDSGPPTSCEALHARIHVSEARYAAKAGTWLDAPNRMVQTRRLRALHARAAELGCALPQV